MQDLLIPHLLDPMHIEKNVSASLLKILSNAKGTKADSQDLRDEMKELGIMPHLWREDGSLDRVPEWIFTKSEFKNVVEVLQNIRTPSGFGSSFRYNFNDKKIVGMKTHDYHNLLQYLLVVAVRGTLTKSICDMIFRLGRLFRWICSKTILKSEISAMAEEAAETLCLFERHFSPSFLDIQVHLVVHLVEEVALCGPISSRWMYFIERYMKQLKGWVRQRAQPEGCMAE